MGKVKNHLGVKGDPEKEEDKIENLEVSKDSKLDTSSEAFIPQRST